MQEDEEEEELTVVEKEEEGQRTYAYALLASAGTNIHLARKFRYRKCHAIRDPKYSLSPFIGCLDSPNQDDQGNLGAIDWAVSLLCSQNHETRPASMSSPERSTFLVVPENGPGTCRKAPNCRGERDANVSAIMALPAHLTLTCQRCRPVAVPSPTWLLLHETHFLWWGDWGSHRGVEFRQH
jgi:hypothetical protein